MSQGDDTIIPTKPYLLRALYEWCTDNGFTPYIAVEVDGSVRVPREHVKNGEIVLNISFEATSALKMSNEDISFKARFGGVPRDILIPVSHVTAIYARENGQGMAFPPPEPQEEKPVEEGPTLRSVTDASQEPAVEALDASVSEEAAPEAPPEPPPTKPTGSHLKRVK